MSLGEMDEKRFIVPPPANALNTEVLLAPAHSSCSALTCLIPSLTLLLRVLRLVFMQILMLALLSPLFWNSNSAEAPPVPSRTASGARL